MLKRKQTSKGNFRVSNTFEYSGPEELSHLQDLLAELTDQELEALASNVGIKFLVPRDQITRQDYEMVIDEAEREDFYREYNKLTKSKIPTKNTQA